MEAQVFLRLFRSGPTFPACLAVVEEVGVHHADAAVSGEEVFLEAGALIEVAFLLVEVTEEAIEVVEVAGATHRIKFELCCWLLLYGNQLDRGCE